MSIHTSQPTPEEVYYAAEKYLACLPEEIRAQLSQLLKDARSGQKRDNAILALLAEDETARRWMRAALFGEEDGILKGGYEPLPGAPASIPANSRWVCPECGFEWLVLHAGRPVPHCPHDYSILIQVKEKE